MTELCNHEINDALHLGSREWLVPSRQESSGGTRKVLMLSQAWEARSAAESQHIQHPCPEQQGPSLHSGVVVNYRDLQLSPEN